MRCLLRLSPAVIVLKRKPCYTQMFTLLHQFTQKHSDSIDYKLGFTCIQAGLKTYGSKQGQPWFEYSSGVFLEFLDKHNTDVSNKEKSFAELEEVLNQFQGQRNSIEYQILNLMGIHKQTDLMLDYIQFIRQKKRDQGIPLVLIKRAIQGITPYNPDEGLKLIYEYMERMPATASELHFLIKSFSYTKDWKCGLKLLKENSHTLSLKETAANIINGDNLLFYILVAALKNKDIDIYNDLKKDFFMILLPSHMQVHLREWLKDGYLTPEILLEILTNSLHGPNYQHACLIKDELERYWGNTIKIEFVKMTDIAYNGSICPACGEKCIKPKYTEKELDVLKGDIIEMLKDSDISRKKMLHELNRLWNFIEENGPFDIVIDTLNLTQGVYVGKLDTEGKQIKKGMKKWGISNPRVLFVAPLGRNNFYTDDRDCNVFESSLKRFDDWFVVLGALMSGPHTYFLSSDLYRDHFYALNRESFSVYIKWSHMRQIYIRRYGRKDSGLLEVIEPKPFINLPFETASGWHIPFSAPKGPDGSGNQGLLSLPETYMCVRKLENWKPSSSFKTLSDELKLKDKQNIH